MQFLIDECVGSTMSDWLKSEGFATFSVFDEWRGASDDEILEKCFSENYILITADKDFGDMVFREQKLHKGIVLIRCNPNNLKQRIAVFQKLLINYSEKLANNFVVITNETVRIIEE